MARLGLNEKFIFENWFFVNFFGVVILFCFKRENKYKKEKT